MKVLQWNNFSVHLYSNHPPPHCYIRFSDGEEILVSVPTFKKIAGERVLTEEIKVYLSEHLDFICNKLDEFNNN